MDGGKRNTSTAERRHDAGQPAAHVAPRDRVAAPRAHRSRGGPRSQGIRELDADSDARGAIRASRDTHHPFRRPPAT